MNATVAWPLPAVALTPVGAFGAVAGTIEFDVPDCVLVAYALLAVTVNVYVVPFERPVIVIGEEPPVAVKPPMFEETVYVVIADPPFETGAVNETVAWPLPAVALTPVGTPGAVTGITEFVAAEAELVPIAFVAVTVNEYVVPFDSPVTTIGDAPPCATNPPVFEVTV